jgi:site-specific recombinase XerD
MSYKVFTTVEINDFCLYFLETCTKAHPRYFPLFDTLYRTGMRFEDCFSLVRWQILENSMVAVSTAKGSDIRLFGQSEINPSLLAAVTSGNLDFFNFSYSTALRYFSLAFPIPNLTIGGKRVKTHIFRHNKARTLKESGLSDIEIQKYLGEKNLSSAVSYIYSTIKG